MGTEAATRVIVSCHHATIASPCDTMGLLKPASEVSQRQDQRAIHLLPPVRVVSGSMYGLAREGPRS